MSTDRYHLSFYALLHNLQSEHIAKHDVVIYISAEFELRRFLPSLDFMIELQIFIGLTEMT